MNRLSFLIITLALLLIGCSKPETINSKQITQKTLNVDKYKKVDNIAIPHSLTTGYTEEEIDLNNNKLFSVMVENSPKSRPHTGLIDADIVYEMEVEYNVTRFLAIFNDNFPGKVGPVRSSRHYFLPIVESWETPYFHYGASKFAYKELPNLEVHHYDGTKNGYKFYERDDSRSAPHNAYLNTSNLIELEPKLSYAVKNPHFKFLHSEDNINEFYKSIDQNVNEIDITYYSGNRVTYTYDETTGRYSRFIQDEPHIDRETSEHISTKNIFILYAEHEDLNTKEKHINIKLDGEGQLIYYVNGKKVEGVWKTENGNIKFFDSEEEVLETLPGNSWIQIVNVDKDYNVLEN